MRRIVYRGLKFAIGFVVERNGGCPAADFFDALSLQNQAKLTALFRIAADHAQFNNPEKFGTLGNGLFEFKSFQIRMPFTYSSSEKQLILVTHGFIKKKDKAPRVEIERAMQLLEEDRRAKLALIKRPKK